VTMKDVAIHDPVRNSLELTKWLSDQDKFGVAATEKMIIVPPEEAAEVRVFRETIAGSS